MSKSKFTKAFLQNHKMVGAVRPSSRFLRSKMIETIDFDKARVIIELGPGTGVFTKRIIEKMHPECQLLIFELNKDFYDHLTSTIQDSRCHFVHDSAEFISKYLEIYELGKADYIVSSLPLANFSSMLRKRLLISSHQNLKDKGRFIQFQYSVQSKVLLETIFSSVQTKFTLLNFPPAFVFSCSR